MRALCQPLRFLSLGICAVALSIASPACGQNGLFVSDKADKAEVPESYSSGAGRLTPTQMIQDKAQIRAALRITRMAAKNWYGYSPARPRTTATPFTGLYGPHFQGYTLGRPAAHHVARPIVVMR